jgi:hypothetical protein
MTGQPGRSGGAREGAGRPAGISNPNAGRPKGATDVTLSPARLISPGQKWAYAERALQYAQEMLDRMVDLARNAESEAVRLAAMDKILDRALGKAILPQLAFLRWHRFVYWRRVASPSKCDNALAGPH